MPEARWGGDDFRYTWENLVPELDKLVLMYWGNLLTFEEIGKETGHDWWTIKQLFAAHDVPRMTIKERAKYKRETLYSMFRRLIDAEGLSLNEIYRQHGYSPPYVRQTLQEGPSPMLQSIDNSLQPSSS